MLIVASFITSTAAEDYGIRSLNPLPLHFTAYGAWMLAAVGALQLATMLVEIRWTRSQLLAGHAQPKEMDLQSDFNFREQEAAVMNHACKIPSRVSTAHGLLEAGRC
jgi:hypothetical protein